MNILFFLFFLECGIIPDAAPDLYYTGANLFYIEMSTDVIVFNTLLLGGGTKCIFSPLRGQDEFQPQVMQYDFRVALILGPVEIGARHRCDHRRENLESIGGREEYYFRISNAPRKQPGN